MDAVAFQKRQRSRRGDMLQAAVVEINHRGMRGMTLASVAGQLGLAAPAVIYYFGSKERLVAEVFLKAISHYDGLVAKAEAGPSAPRKIELLLGAFFSARGDIDMGGREPVVLFNDVRALNNAEVNAAFVALFRRVRGLLPHTASLTAVDRNARAHLLLAQLFWAVAWARRFNIRDYPLLAPRMADILLGGLVPAGGPSVETSPLQDIPAPPATEPRELFLRAATELINAEGYHGASVERISARVHVTKGAFYHHHHTKNDLVIACFQRTIDTIWRTLESAGTERTGLGVLTSTCATLIDHQFQGESPLLSTTALSTLPAAMQTEITEKIDQIGRRYAMLVSDGVADGSIRPVDVNVAAQLLVGAVNAAAELPFWTPGLAPARAVATFGRLIFAGLGAKPMTEANR
ncbi:MAG: TetR/AcrR family transcriptional regulator [Caulobacteraceae bacterium]